MNSVVNHILFQIDDILRQSHLDSFGLLDGKAGMAYYFYQKYLLNTNNEDYDKATQLIHEALAFYIDTDLEHLDCSFAEGISGLGFILSIMEKSTFLQLDLEKTLLNVDEFLFQKTLLEISDGNWDFLYGAMGIIHYFIERLPHPKFEHYLTLITKQLFEFGIGTQEGLRKINFLNPPSMESYINLSLSHGLCGVFLTLIKIYKAGIQKENIQEILTHGITYLLTYKKDIDIDAGDISFYPFFIHKETGAPKYGRLLGWCYGDLNQTLLLYRFYEITQNKYYKSLADLIGTYSLVRKNSDLLHVEDMFFCYGTVGLAQFYKTLFHISDIQRYYEGYEYWMEQTLIYLFEENSLESIPKGIINGLSGIGLVFLTYPNNHTSHWTKPFLL